MFSYLTRYAVKAALQNPVCEPHPVVSRIMDERDRSARLYMSLLTQTKSSGGDARISIDDRDKDVWPSDCLHLSTDILARKNPFPQDARIQFVESTHKYYIDGKEAPISVTGFIKAPFSTFDARAQCERLARGGNPKYSGMTPKQIGLSWIANGRAASGLGTTMHAAVEVALNTGYWSQDPRILPEMEMAKRFVKEQITDKGLVPFRTEPIVFIDPVKTGGLVLPGSVDCVCRDPKTNEFWIFDWKRSKGLTKTVNGRHGYGHSGPFQSDEDIDYTKYSIQLHMYRYIMQTYYGLNIPKSHLYMVVFHPKNDNYVMFQAKDMSDKITWLIENYQWCIEQSNTAKAQETAYTEWAQG